MVAALMGANYSPRASPTGAAVAYEANDAGTSPDSYLKLHTLQLLLPVTVAAFLLLTFVRFCFRRLTRRSGRVCPDLIPPTGHSSTVHGHRRHCARRLLWENLRELGPIWLTAFFLVEWAVSALLDRAHHHLGLAVHPHSLPRQADLSHRWRRGECRRCHLDTLDIIAAAAQTVATIVRVTLSAHRDLDLGSRPRHPPPRTPVCATRG